MKNILKTLKLFSLFSLLPAACYLLLFPSCEQPFKAGLGPLIDLQDPTIVLDSPIAGASIRDITTFKGRASDDYQLDSVWFNISNYPMPDDPTEEQISDYPLPSTSYKKIKVGNDIFYKITDTSGDSRNITWKFDIDTARVDNRGERVFPDGDFKLRLRVTDSMGKEVITDEIVFYIKNDPPLITLTDPSMLQGGPEDTGSLGSDHLNYDFDRPFKRTMDTNGKIMGRISDHTGINRSKEDPRQKLDEKGNPMSDDNYNPIMTKELFPPQIRFWQVYFDDQWPVDKQGVPVRAGTAYPDRYYPSPGEVPWVDLGTGTTTLEELNVTDMQFTYQLGDVAGSYYAFELRAQSKDGIASTVEYPRDYSNYENNRLEENLYVLILLREPVEKPDIQLYDLEDIYGDQWGGKPVRATDPNSGSSKTVYLYNDLPGLGPADRNKIEGNHEYVLRDSANNKKGPFTLRVKASHTGGIASAAVYWEKSDKSKKGRFIWDPVPPSRPWWTWWRAVIPSPAAHYTEWGLNEPDGVTEVRSFVFTYSDLNKADDNSTTAKYDRLEERPEFANNIMGDIRGRSKIQVYTGEKNNPNNDNKPYKFDELPDDLRNWTDIYKLDEGTYNIYVYATSNSGTPVKDPLYVSITIDRIGPSIDLNYIQGSAGEITENRERKNTVNGVISPKFLISDSRPVDAGFREEIKGNISKYFWKNSDGTNCYLEQAYILISQNDAFKMQEELVNNPWPFLNETPDPSNSATAAPVISGVTIKKHGPLDENMSCKFKTSYIYNDGSDTGAGKDDLPDGEYRLYAFARDGAFNVNYKSFPIKVERESDYPKIDLGDNIKKAVTQPDSAYDYTKANDSNASANSNKGFGFFIKGDDNPRNMFTASSSIQLKITDDDSLYMFKSTTTDQPGIEITLLGSKPNSSAVLEQYNEDTHLITLQDDQIKQAFNPFQTLEGLGRSIVLDSRGSITHRMLAELVRTAPAYDSLYTGDKVSATTLPDGIYRVGISVSDDRSHKLRMSTDTKGEADSVTVNISNYNISPSQNPPTDKKIEYFWIAVDNSKPIVTGKDTSGNDTGKPFELPPNTTIKPGVPQELSGYVSDENGPITLVGWKIRDGSTPVSDMSMGSDIDTNKPRIAIKSGADYVTLTESTNNLKYIEYKKGKWVYDFTYYVDLPATAKASYDFEITFQDRFKKTVTLSPKFTVDNVPPTVSLIKPIETFSRTMIPDTDITTHTHISTNIQLNKERLAVKVVNFGISADDASGIAGIRWWLLPANVGADKNQLNATGFVSGYDAWPVGYNGAGFNPDTPKVWYPSDNISSFSNSIFGVMQVPDTNTSTEAKYTVAFDSRKVPDGEYRLHIIAVDGAGNYSNYLNTSINVDNVFQVVFFLQKQDEPYFDNNITPGVRVEDGADDGRGWPTDKVVQVLGGAPVISGTIWENNGFFRKNTTTPQTLAWDNSVTIWLSGEGKDLPIGWKNMVQSNSEIDGYKKMVVPATSLDPQDRNINLSIELTSLFPNEFKSDADGRKRYIIKATDSPVNKLKELQYPTYSIYTPDEGNAEKMGMGYTDGTGSAPPDNDGNIRESNYRQYAFVYDGVPPTVVIDTPLDKPSPTTYGKVSFKNPTDGFVLGGYISDANLATLKYYYESLKPSDPDYKPLNNGEYTGTDGSKYYFKYYVNKDTQKLFILEPRTDLNFTVSTPISVDANGAPTSGSPTSISWKIVDGKTIPIPPATNKDGQHIYVITQDNKGKITVYFRIGVNDVANNTKNPNNTPKGIIPSDQFEGIKDYAGKGLPEGQNTLYVWAWDLSGKPGAAWVNFIKDIEPPKITFSNLTHKTGKNSNYDSTNDSKVDKATWWSTTPANITAKQTLLLVDDGSNASPKRPLPLTTIYYDTGIPELRGTITDLVSNIKLTTTTNPNVGTGDINSDAIPNADPSLAKPASAFKYWIDGETTPRYHAVIDGKDTKSVRWTINLTDNLVSGDGKAGTTGGKPLYDGVHTIVLTAADVSGEEIPEAQRYMIAFRIDSKPPRSAVSVTGVSSDVVFGNTAYQTDPMFTLNVTGDDANLERVELQIVNTTTTPTLPTKVTFTARDSDTWTYYPKGVPLPTTITLPDSLTRPDSPLTEDYVLFQGKHPVSRTLFTNDGKYEVKVVAYDTRDNKSEEYVFRFTYDKTAPVIEFTSPANENQNGTGTPVLTPTDFIDSSSLAAQNKISRLTSDNLRIQGTVKDTFSPILKVESRVERWDWATGAWVLVPEQGQIDGWKSLGDYSNNTQTQVAWTKNLLGQNNTDSNPSVDLDIRKIDTNNPSGEGLYRIRIRAKDASKIARPFVGGGNDGWESPTGEGNPITSGYVYFYYDRTNPTLEITGINGSTTAMQTYYSKPPSGGFRFNGTVTDNNRFAKVEVEFKTAAGISYPMTVTRSNPDGGATITSLNQGPATQKWTAVFTNASLNLPDGKYTVTVTVADMAGRTASETKSFILDGTSPTMKFTLPAKVPNKGYGDDSENKKPTTGATTDGFASVMVNGGENAVITGVTDDKPGVGGETGSQSGVDQMWFHLGFIDGDTYNTANPFPTKQAIKDWEDKIIRLYARNVHVVVDTNGVLTEEDPNSAWDGIADLTVKQRNFYMDKVSDYRAPGENAAAGNAWFKLGSVNKEIPTGFVINNPNIYDWRFEIPNNYPVPASGDATNGEKDLEAMNITPVTIGSTHYYPIGGLKLYGSREIKIKNRTYYLNPTSAQPNRRMVMAVPGQAGGVYRLPLWVRVTDIAGNVDYYCHDIWIDTNGDIPTTSIESPPNSSKSSARGGTISVDGVARSNTSVYDVIFRVFADNQSTTDLDGTSKTIGTNPIDLPDAEQRENLVKVLNYETVTDTGVLNRIPADYKKTDWQRANLTLTGGSGEPIIPWSIMLNSEDQIKNLIGTRGFNSDNPNSPTATKDMIRVWMEVFVFNGEGSPIRSSIYADDTLNTGNGELYGKANPEGPLYQPGPKPYVRSFYIKTGAAQITHPNVATWANNAFTWNPETPGSFGEAYYGYKGAGTETRSKQFAVKAILDPNPSNTSSSGLGEVAYRIRLDGGAYTTWTTAWSGKPNAQTGALEPVLPANSGGVRITRRTDTVTPAHGYRYDFVYAIDSTTPTSSADWAVINSGAWMNTGGTITVQIRIKDNLSPPNEAVQTIQVSVDNFTPLADKDYRSNSKVAGTNVNFIGRVYDYANPISPIPTSPTADYPSTTVSDSMNSEYTPRKLARVSVWFTKVVNGTTRYVNMNGVNGKPAPVAGLPTTPPNSRSISVAPVNSRTAKIVGGGVNDAVTNITVTDRGGAVASMNYPGLGTQQAWTADYVRDITPATGQPVNKMLWSQVNSSNYDVRWSLTLDSTLLPDGEMTLHYIVVDEAGNASYYTQTGISVRNNYPEINKVTLYTDNNGQGAQYTMVAEQEYSLNDYRSKMFANYTDPSEKAKQFTTGYLNSGFISKNKYIGFKVETDNGNRPLKFRLQHVTREKIELDSTNLGQMVTDRTNTSKISLYTIAWNGNYTPQKWKALGVPIDNPTLGTHFVFNPVNLADPTKAFVVADAVGTAEVWRYTAVVTRDDITNFTGAGQAANSTDTVVYGPTDDFRFFGDTHFNNDAKNTPNMTGRINEFDGSHPTLGDTKDDDPTKTAFFLIRVWDSISATGGADDMLYDALVVGMNVYLTDKNPPVARLYDLNPYTEAKVTEGNPTTTIREAANPTAIGSNIVRGGLYNAGTSRAMVRSGFIDPRGGSTALTPKNGVYFRDKVKESDPAAWQLINGLSLPDYPLKVATDGSPAGTIPGAARDQVSGKIILRGHAWDDQLVDEIRISINNATPFAILKLNASGKMVTQPGYTDTAFVIEDLHWKTGHSVEWAYIWDTEKVPASLNGGPSTTPVTVQVTVTDRNGGNSSETYTMTQETADAAASKKYHNQISVDVVPYITGFERKTPDFTTKRSLQGWYSFYRGEQDVKVNGYNFGDTAGSVTLGGTPMTNVRNGTPASQQRVFNIPTGASSGAIMVTTSVAAYNNYTLTAGGITGKSWNREFNAYTPGSDLWINKPYAHIWRTEQEEGSSTTPTAGTIFASGQTSAGLDSPGMSLQYTESTNGGGVGRLHGVWTTYGRESFFYAQNSADKPSFYNNAITNPTIGNATSGEGADSPAPTGIPYKRPGSVLLVKSGEPYSAGDIDYYNNNTNGDYRNNISAVAAYQRDGGPWLILKPRLSAIVFNNNNSTDGGGTDGAYSITREQNPVSTNRWRNTRIKKVAVSTSDAHPGKVFVTAYDLTYKRLLFKTVNDTVQPSQGTRDNNGGTEYYIDGGTSTTGVGGIGAATMAGNWVALDYTSGGNPVVAYFDEQHQTLRIAYGGTTTPAAGDWTRRYVLQETNPLYLGSGSYVSMAIDRAPGANQNRVHLAFYNSNQKAVVYATGTINAAGFTLTSASVIDRVVEGGQWTDISVDNTGNPWIVYADSARLGNRDGARIAYKGDFTRELKDPISGTMITGWEALTMPANYKVNDDRLNIAAWPPSGIGSGAAATCPIGGWNAAVGYASDLYRIGYFFKPTVPTGF